MTRCVVLGVTGSIAAYKAVELVRELKKGGWDVLVVMTANALRFVSELTFRTLSQNPVATDMFPEHIEWKAEHISLAERANVLAIVPCTANVLAKLACGIADDLLTCTALACRAPIVVAPAMNRYMWEHPATQNNVQILKRRGVRIVEVEQGELACGDEGKGRLAALDKIVAAIVQAAGQVCQ